MAHDWDEGMRRLLEDLEGRQQQQEQQEVHLQEEEQRAREEVMVINRLGWSGITGLGLTA